MDLLEIDGQVAYFCSGDGTRKLVSEITTGDINSALQIILKGGDIGIASSEDASMIVNPAQRVIFEQLRNSFREVLDSRDSIIEEVNSVFASAEAKYLHSES